MMKKNLRLISFVLLLSLLFTGCGAAGPVETNPPGTQTTAEETLAADSSFAVHFIDVGQADAALVLCDGQAMLIDGGNAEDSNLLYTYLKKQGVDHLAYVIGTHAHEDHIGGIAGALNYATVDTVYCPVTEYSSKAFDNFVSAAEKHGAQLTVPTVGTAFTLGSAQCTVLAVNTDDDTNNTSIVLRIVYGETSFLFTGDAETLVEDAILDSGADIASTVLKVGHHGSDTSTGYRWLREVDPDYAVISVGTGNSYGHPTETVLSRLRDAEVTTYRTDLQGDILCTSDGRSVSFTLSKNENADTFGSIGENSTQPGEIHYILNTSSKKFHLESCAGAAKISDANRQDYYGTREELIEEGYTPCGTCDP